MDFFVAKVANNHFRRRTPGSGRHFECVQHCCSHSFMTYSVTQLWRQQNRT